MTDLRTDFVHFDTQAVSAAAHASDSRAVHTFFNEMGLIQDVPTDGVTDAYPIIQDHINRHKAVFLLPGNYRLSHALRITVSDFHYFRGMGQTTVLKPDPGINAIEIDVQSDYLRDPLFADFGISGGLNGIYVAPSPYQTLGGRFDNLHIANHTVAGINFANSIYGVVFTCVHTTGGQYGVKMVGTLNISSNTFLQCDFYNYSVAGLSINGYSNGASPCLLIQSGLFQGAAGSTGIDITSMSFVVIQNTYHEGGAIGINLNGAQSITIDTPYFTATSDVALQITNSICVNLINFSTRGLGVRWNGVLKFQTTNLYSMITRKPVYTDDSGNVVS